MPTNPNAPEGRRAPTALDLLLLRRREFLRWVASGAAAAALPWASACSDASARGETVARFLGADERELLESLGAALVPEDATAGAIGTDAVEYIDRFLAAFDNPVPAIYRGGPFSGRTPYPDPETGEPSDRYPDDSFLDVLPLSRTQEAAWRIALYGSASVENGDINAPLVSPTRGARAIYRDAIAALADAARGRGAARFAELDEAARLELFAQAPAEFRDLYLTHLAEGMFCAPEYGGNRDLRGWTDYAFDGDSQPLGHTLFDRRTGTLRDRPDQPNQTADPHDPGTGLEAEVESFVESIVKAQGGKRFF